MICSPEQVQHQAAPGLDPASLGGSGILSLSARDKRVRGFCGPSGGSMPSAAFHKGHRGIALPGRGAAYADSSSHGIPNSASTTRTLAWVRCAMRGCSSLPPLNRRSRCSAESQGGCVSRSDPSRRLVMLSLRKALPGVKIG